MRAATGTQFSVAFGDSRATITELAAGLRGLVLNGVEVVREYPEQSLPPMGQGIVLVPWPNRIAKGAWVLDGVKQQLDITEPSTGNATHGLLRNTAYSVAEEGEGFLTLRARVFPQHGYPFLLDTSVSYEISEAGLTVTHAITNESDSPAPVAVGAHPYFVIGSTPTEDLTLTIAADTVFEYDDAFIPTAEVPVDDAGLDLRAGRHLSEVDLNHAFGSLTETGGQNIHTLVAPDGQRVELWTDSNFAYVQAYNPREFPFETGTGMAIALEPMTAPANAFNTGEGLHWVEPGASWMLSWGVRYRPAS
ncbi:aldose 1-epimerase family protein [Agreia pratensis]|uniref:aldose 1-epimerase family protein n=1 Tax=Agreia pratensis TaxID=150121 RepID=UPI00188BD926|nr:aldose 1-epimerase family protein [Agreia pratensis]MBF4635504.1 aldose 1-epimerase family protein [Agreia pratensis]